MWQCIKCKQYIQASNISHFLEDKDSDQRVVVCKLCEQEAQEHGLTYDLYFTKEKPSINFRTKTANLLEL